MKAETKTGVNELPLEEGEKKGKAEKKAGKRIGFNYIIVKSLKESQKNDVVKCLYIKSLTKWGFCVIKEGTSGDTKDKHGRDIRDRLIWQKQLHAQLQKKIRLPRYYGSFEENGNYYLVIEHIKGKSLGSVIRKEGRKLREELIKGGKTGEKFLGYLIQITDLLMKLHGEKVVHRDATAGNFLITRSGKVAVIDMELSYALDEKFPTPPFELGTTGFMSPQQERVHIPTIQEDIFAVGAIILQVWTGISPSKLTRPPIGELADRIKFFIQDEKLSEVVIRCLQPEPENRCTLKELQEELNLYKSDLIKRSARKKNSVKQISKDQVLDLVQNGIMSICSPQMADPEKGWFAQNQQTANEDKNKLDKEYYASLQFGTAGVMYFMNQAAQIGLNIESALPHIQSGLSLIEKKYLKRLDTASPGFYYGSSGVAVALDFMYRSGVMKDETIASWVKALVSNQNDEWGLLNGRTGHAMAVLRTLQPGSQSEQKRLKEDVDFLLALQQKDGAWVYPPGKKSKKPRILLSFLNGIAGVVYFLLEYAIQHKDQATMEKAEAGLHYLIRKATTYQGRLLWKNMKGQRLGFGWCEGNGGIALTFLKAFEVTGNQTYRSYAQRALEGIAEDIVDNSLCQCHGISGLGEIYIEAYKVLGEERWLKKSQWITQILINTRMVSNNGVFWLTEQERQPIAGFMIGNSGILHYLMRYVMPDDLCFPLIGTNKSEYPINKITNPEMPAGLQSTVI